MDGLSLVAAGVTSFQDAPPSRVTEMTPVSLPVQMTSLSR
jgi:hypothetical protein